MEPSKAVVGVRVDASIEDIDVDKREVLCYDVMQSDGSTVQVLLLSVLVRCFKRTSRYDADISPKLKLMPSTALMRALRRCFSSCRVSSCITEGPGHTAGRREVSVQRVQAAATSEIACLMMDSFDCSYPMCQLDIDSP